MTALNNHEDALEKMASDIHLALQAEQRRIEIIEMKWQKRMDALHEHYRPRMVALSTIIIALATMLMM